MRHDLARLLAQPIAHRGLHDCSRGVVENSLAAAEAAIDAGYGIECDIQPSGDGKAIVFHDDTLDRLTAQTGRLDARTAAELAAIALSAGRDTIPTLAEFIACIGGRAPLVIEIKSQRNGDMRHAAHAVTLISAYTGLVALKSFDAAVIAYCRSLGATCPLGLVGPENDGGQPVLDAFDFVSWHVAELATLQSRTPIMTWTVRSREDQMVAERFGAQIVFEHYDPGIRRHSGQEATGC